MQSDDVGPPLGLLAGSVIFLVLIEDNRMVREGMATLLNEQPDLRVVAGESNADMSMLRRLGPRVVLLDLGLRNGDGLAVAARIMASFPRSRVIVMDLQPVHGDVDDFIRAGVAGIISQGATLEDLVSTIRLVAKGGRVLPAVVPSSLLTERASHAKADGEAGTLQPITKREREVIDHIASGMSNKEMAAEMQIAAHTVKSHVRNIMEKLTLHTRLQISAYAHRGSSS